jgi:hypothetical protein
MSNNFFTSDYSIKNESDRIVCDCCDWPATTGMNNGAAPFWYLCGHCALLARMSGRIEVKTAVTI